MDPGRRRARKRPLVLLGHGGGQHKSAPGMLGERVASRPTGSPSRRSTRPATATGPVRIASGDSRELMAERLSTGESVAAHVGGYHAAVADQAVGDWKSVLGALQEVVGKGSRVGYWGVSLGAAIGLPFVAADSRISAAVIGLVSREMVPVRAARVTIPLEFLVQWDDELVPRESALELFDALGSTEKSLHANPGSHGGVPRFEVESAARFFLRHLV